MTAIFRHGNPVMGDYTPGAAVTAGDVIVVGDTVRVAHHDIAANAQGELALAGGVYRMPKSTAGSSAIADGKKVYWDATNSVITTTATSNKQFGFTVGASADADATQTVHHVPN